MVLLDTWLALGDGLDGLTTLATWAAAKLATDADIAEIKAKR